MRFFLFAFSLLAILSTAALADMPLPPPKEVKVFSNNKAYMVISTPNAKTWVVEVKTNRELWSMPGWNRWIFVSNDGRNVVTGYSGINLLPVDYKDDWVLITFWEKGKKTKELRVKDIIPDKSILRSTTSHYEWGSIIGIDEKGKLVVNRADGKMLKFEVKTGKEE
jgi:hypothetical protein